MSFKGFQRLNGTLRALSEVPSRVAADASVRIAGLIDGSFDAGTDPYGRPWAPLSTYTLAKGRFPPPLTDSGAMRASIDVHPTAGAGIEVTLDSEYATFHQTGTRYMPQRQILPQSAGLAPSWREAIAEAVRANVAKARR
jgi:phage gpG-like protein